MTDCLKMENSQSHAETKIQERTPRPLKTIRFIVMGDSHLVAHPSKRRGKPYKFDMSGLVYKSILRKIKNSGVHYHFAIHGGDSVGNRKVVLHKPTATDYIAFRKLTASQLQGIPIYYTVGNWDRITLFKRHLQKQTSGIRPIQGTGGRLKYVFLNTQRGTFDSQSIETLRKLDGHSQYIIDFHYPLRIEELINQFHPNHILSPSQTALFFHSIPSEARPQILAIFTHHEHKFMQNQKSIWPGFSETRFFVCPSAGGHRSPSPGYVQVSLTLKNNRYHLEKVTQKRLAIHG